MKNYLKFGLLAFVAAALSARSVYADSVISNHSGQGDLILNFTQAAGTQDLEVDLGPIAEFVAATSGTFATGSAVSLSSYLNTADLVTAFGSSWNSASDNVYWGLFADTASQKMSATGFAKNTLFVSDANNATVITPDNTNENDGQITGQLGVLANATATGDSNDHAALFTTGASGSFSEESGIYGTDADNPAVEPTGGYYGGVLGAFQNDTFIEQTNGGSTTEALYEVPQQSGGSSTYVGTFTLNSSGISFDSAAAVPEPSTWASIGLGALVLIGLRRRRRIA